MPYCRFVGAALAAACFALPSAGVAQPKQVWKASDVHPLGYPTVEAIVRMGKKLEAQTGGRYSIQMFPSMQLGGEKEMIEQAQVGALQIARISVGAMGPVVDDLNVFNMPFIFRDEQHMRKVIDGPIGQELLERTSNAPTSRLVVLGWMDAGTRNVYSNKPVSKRNWETLPKADQDLVKKLSREAQLEQRQLWDAYVGEAESKLKAAGIQFVSADKEAFYKATQPVRDKYGAKYSALLKRIQDTQ